MAPSPADVLRAVKSTGVTYNLIDGWNDPQYMKNASLNSDGSFYWEPKYVINHHTAGSSDINKPAESLGWMLYGNKGNNGGFVRACHFLIGRDGIIHVLYSFGTWHAGRGGAYGGIPQDEMNNYAYGIEVESAGLVPDFTVEQLDSLARLDVALCNLMGVGFDHAINHKTWAPTRKIDTKYTDKFLQGNMKNLGPTPEPVPLPTKEIIMLLVRRAGSPSVYFLTGNQMTLLDSGDDYRAFLAAGVKEVNLTQASFDAILAGKD